jgi:hypothetical protein
VQHVHAEDDLFQRTGRHGADDDGVEAVEKAEAPVSCPDAGRDPAKIDGDGFTAELGGGPLEIANVPAGAVGEDGPSLSGERRVASGE